MAAEFEFNGFSLKFREIMFKNIKEIKFKKEVFNKPETAKRITKLL